MYSVDQRRKVKPDTKQIQPSDVQPYATQVPSRTRGDDDTTRIQLAIIQNAINLDRALNQKSSDKFRGGRSADRRSEFSVTLTSGWSIEREFRKSTSESRM